MSSRPLLPTELSLHRALAIARWGSWLWTAGVVAFGGDDLEHPAGAAVCVVAAFGVAVAGTAGARGRAWVGGAPFAVVQAVVAAVLAVADGWVFTEGHTFAVSQNLAAASPPIAAAGLGVALGVVPGLIGGALLGAARIPSSLINGSDSFTGPQWASFASSIVFVGLAGAVVGWLAATLRTVEREVITRRERDTIARTLHDTVLQTLAMVSRRSDDADLARLARRTDAEVRRFLYGPTTAPVRTLSAAVHDAAGNAAERFDLDVVVNVVDDEPGTTGPAAEAVATAVGEAVTNAGKHSRVRRVVVYAEQGDEGLFASIRDDGAGFDASDVTLGQGLRSSIRQPVEAAGGRVEIDSRPGEGTEVRVWIP
jgi:signal transduction histidine kinase